jgi:hypothetical protein
VRTTEAEGSKREVAELPPALCCLAIRARMGEKDDEWMRMYGFMGVAENSIVDSCREL